MNEEVLARRGEQEGMVKPHILEGFVRRDPEGPLVYYSDRLSMCNLGIWVDQTLPGSRMRRIHKQVRNSLLSTCLLNCKLVQLQLPLATGSILQSHHSGMCGPLKCSGGPAQDVLIRTETSGGEDSTASFTQTSPAPAQHWSSTAVFYWATCGCYQRRAPWFVLGLRISADLTGRAGKKTEFPSSLVIPHHTP